MNERPTPETDAAAEEVGMGHFMVDADFARKLERERDEARAESSGSHALFGSWIAERYPTPESAKLQCAEATAAMVEAFPTLRRVRGHAMIGIDFRPHWWCVTERGEIVDPTAHQWPATPAFYDAIPEDSEEPCGKCIYCGDLLFRSRGADSYLCENCKPNNVYTHKNTK